MMEFLLGKGYEVHGLIRHSSNYNTAWLDHIYIDSHNSSKARMKLHYANLSNALSLRSWVDSLLPDEVYNLTAQSYVAVSFEIPDYTADVIATGSLRLLEAVRSSTSSGKPICYYQAGSSEMFGSTPPHQSESSPFHPRSPYAAAKVTAHWYIINYHEAYGLFACNGILFNHESPRRRENRSPAPSAGSALACKPSFSSGICRPPVTGALPGTTSRPCGSCCSRMSPTLSFLLEPVAIAASTHGLLCCRGHVSGGYYVCNPTTTAWEFFFRLIWTV